MAILKHHFPVIFCQLTLFETPLGLESKICQGMFRAPVFLDSYPIVDPTIDKTHDSEVSVLPRPSCHSVSYCCCAFKIRIILIKTFEQSISVFHFFYDMSGENRYLV